MIEFLIILAIISGFVISQYLTFKHIAKLQILLKANSLAEAKYYENKPEIDDEEEELTLEDIADRPAEEVQQMFRQPIQN